MPTKKKSTSKKKTAKKRSVAAAHKVTATKTRKELAIRLREDLKAAKEALKAANIAARKEINLAKAAAKAEAAVLKDQLAAARKREQVLLKLGKQKAKEMWKAGEQWEKKQMAKIKAIKSKRKGKS